MHETAEELKAAVAAAAPRLSEFTEAESGAAPAPGKWSKKQVLGHLIDSATNNHQRFVRAQLGGELVFPGYEQEGWVKVQAYQNEPWDQLIRLWVAYNLHLAHVMSCVAADKLETRCVIGAYEPATLSFLMTDYVRHLKHHLGQIFAAAAAAPPGQ